MNLMLEYAKRVTLLTVVFFMHSRYFTETVIGYLSGYTPGCSHHITALDNFLSIPNYVVIYTYFLFYILL